MKRLLALLACAAITFSLAACGGNDSTSIESDDNETTSTVTAETEMETESETETIEPEATETEEPAETEIEVTEEAETEAAEISGTSDVDTTETDSILSLIFPDMEGYERDENAADKDALEIYTKADADAVTVVAIHDLGEVSSILKDESNDEAMVAFCTNKYDSDDITSTRVITGDFNVLEISGSIVSEGVDCTICLFLLPAGDMGYLIQGQSTADYGEQMMADIRTMIENIAVE